MFEKRAFFIFFVCFFVFFFVFYDNKSTKIVLIKIKFNWFENKRRSI